MIAFGIVFRGFFTSLAGRVPISKPTYAQKISTNATPKFPNPSVLVCDYGAARIVSCEVDAGVVDRLGRGSHGEVDEAAHAARHLAVHRDRGIEIADLGDTSTLAEPAVVEDLIRNRLAVSQTVKSAGA